MPTRRTLPPRVYLKHGAFYHVDYERKWTRLSAERDGIPAMLRALATLQERHSVRGERMPAVVARWLTSKLPEWSASSRRNGERIANEISLAFREFAPAEVTTPVCAKYLSRYADRPRTHNQHRNALRQILAFAAVEGLREGHNPVDNVRGLSTPGRHRIVTDDELLRLHAAAADTVRGDTSARAAILVLELALVTGQRVGDLLGLRWQDVTPAGLHIEQGKSRRSAAPVRLLIEWTPALTAAVDACVIGTNRIGHLIKTRTGSRYTYAGIRSAWVRLCARAGIDDLHIHDLRGRAGADLEQSAGREAARALLGHQTQRTTAHYVEGKRVPKVRPAR
jgi:integrase